MREQTKESLDMLEQRQAIKECTAKASRCNWPHHGPLITAIIQPLIHSPSTADELDVFHRLIFIKTFTIT